MCSQVSNRFLFFVLILSFSAFASSPADIVFRNGAVYTVDAARSWHSSVAIKDGRIIYVGDELGINSFIESQTKVIDLDGRMLLPGFIDGHVHPISAGMRLRTDYLVLDDIVDREEIYSKIREFAEKQPDLDWIVGGGWNEAAFMPEGAPTKEILDTMVPDRPVILRNNSGHQAWVNSRALEIAGIDKRTPDPTNPVGRIEHDADGQVTGILSEGATYLVGKYAPPVSEGLQRDGLGFALKMLREHGITSLMDAAVSPQSLQTYYEAEQAGELTVRVEACQRYRPDSDDREQIRNFIQSRAGLGGGLLTAGCIKIGLDGIGEYHTASVLEPYSDRPGDYGPINVDPPRFKTLVTQLDKEGFQIHIHTMADRAVRESLDAFELARRENGPRDARPTLAHLQLIDPADIPRFRQLGVIANMTPLWGRGDEWETVLAPRVYGSERSQRLLQHRTLLAQGVSVVWGTDWGVTSLSPLEGIETAVTRRYLGGVDLHGNPDQAWLPEERLLLEEAIVAYTITGAYLLFAETERGSIEVGKLADLVVLEKNLFDVPNLEIHRVKTDLTMLGGKIIYQRK